MSSDTLHPLDIGIMIMQARAWLYTSRHTHTHIPHPFLPGLHDDTYTSHLSPLGNMKPWTTRGGVPVDLNNQPWNMNYMTTILMCVVEYNQLTYNCFKAPNGKAKPISEMWVQVSDQRIIMNIEELHNEDTKSPNRMNQRAATTARERESESTPKSVCTYIQLVMVNHAKVIQRNGGDGSSSSNTVCTLVSWPPVQ